MLSGDELLAEACATFCPARSANAAKQIMIVARFVLVVIVFSFHSHRPALGRYSYSPLHKIVLFCPMKSTSTISTACGF
jgi:hypothetical protein